MRIFWLVVDSVRPALLLVAVLAPFLLLGLGLAIAHRRRATSPGSATAGGGFRLFGVGVALAPIILWFAFCTPPPGQGRRAHEGKQRGATLVAALEEYRRTTGRYPDSLNQLVPTFASSEIVQKATTARQADAWEYRVDSTASFHLAFHYVGPGRNRCSITASRPTWGCSGYF